MTAAVLGNPSTFAYKTTFFAGTSGSGGGSAGVGELLHAGLATWDDRGELRAQLAEAVPSIENGLWKLFPDGRNETTWKLRPGGHWHDGTPLTAEDVVFTDRVARDRDMAAFFRDNLLLSVEGVEAPDPQTIVIRWRQPQIHAVTLFSRAAAQIMPRHLLEEGWLQGQADFPQHPYWGSDDFVGAGPYRLREWVLGSHLVLEAHGRYTLGRPKIDQIEVRFFQDPNTLLTNVLAGTVDLTLGGTLSLEQALQVRDRWGAGRVDIGYKDWMVILPQFIDPIPRAIGEVAFRRAMLHAIDRQQLVETLMGGAVPIAHSPLIPTEPEYQEVEPNIIRYAYEPRIALQLLEEIGFRRGVDGQLRDAGSQRLAVEIRAQGGDLEEKTLLAVADSWRQIGLAVDALPIPQQRQSDRAYVATFPGFHLMQHGNDLISILGRFRSRSTPLPENNFAGANRNRYVSQEFDALIDRFYTTVARGERVVVIGELLRHITDRMTMLSLFYGTEATVLASRLQHVGTTNRSTRSTQAWNAHEWDLRS